MKFEPLLSKFLEFVIKINSRINILIMVNFMETKKLISVHFYIHLFHINDYKIKQDIICNNYKITYHLQNSLLYLPY
jgi:hypothetical protein